MLYYLFIIQLPNSILWTYKHNSKIVVYGYIYFYGDLMQKRINLLCAYILRENIVNNLPNLYEPTMALNNVRKRNLRSLLQAFIVMGFFLQEFQVRVP